jgi:hypothetical protein
VGGVEEAPQLDPVVLDPVPVRVLARNAGLDLVVGDDPFLLQVHEKHLSRLQPSLLQDPVGGKVHHAGFRGHDDHAVARDRVPGGPQAVPVQGGPDVSPVAEHECGRAVPRLHDGGVVLVERPLVLAHVELRSERLGHHHHHGVGEGSAGHHQQLQGVVEDRGVASLLDDHGLDLLEVVAEPLRFDDRLPRAHPVDVPPKGIDLPVVREKPVRVREMPRGEGVRAVSLVDHGEGAREERIAQVREERGELGPREQPLVDEGARRKARDVELAGVAVGPASDLLLRQAPDDVELPLEVVPVAGPVREEDLSDRGLRHPGELPERIRVCGDLPPPQNGAPFLVRRALEGCRAAVGKRFVRRQEDQSRRVLAPGRKGKGKVPASVAEKGVRDLQENPCPVPRRLVAADRAAVLEVHEDLHGVLHDRMLRHCGETGDETDAAAVMLLVRMVQAGREGGSGCVGSGKPCMMGHDPLPHCR